MNKGIAVPQGKIKHICARFFGKQWLLFSTGTVYIYYNIQYIKYKHYYFAAIQKNDKKLLVFVILLS